MRTPRIIVAIGLALAASACLSTPPIAGPLPTDAPLRSEILAFAEKDRVSPPPACPVLFVGSSSIRLWSTLTEDMAPLPVINRGFGGSTIAQANSYFDRIVTPYRPRAIVIYSGENDIDSGAQPNEVIERFKTFLKLKDARLGDTPVFYIAAKPSKLRADQFPRQTAANAGIRALADARADLHFIDVVSAMLDDGKPKDLYVEDGLHMSPAGYAIWRDLVMNALVDAGIPGRSCD
ncbi:GDSL-type esterase/lipase family protein [Allosphingosinicella vermicomposti]|uniref:GDSL-type esterase/lipase family protein n=1 Tax=Allosphingosinicella vermicomposti TaxID=614671 RepID=UPI000D0E6257|nr:GDSL-type esterase/lipase family protein [Allosphingosinicella vermicomposti]